MLQGKLFQIVVPLQLKLFFHVVSSWKGDKTFIVYWDPQRIVWLISLSKFRREIFGNQTVKRPENHYGVLNSTLRFQVFPAEFNLWNKESTSTS